MATGTSGTGTKIEVSSDQVTWYPICVFGNEATVNFGQKAVSKEFCLSQDLPFLAMDFAEFDNQTYSYFWSEEFGSLADEVIKTAFESPIYDDKKIYFRVEANNSRGTSGTQYQAEYIVTAYKHLFKRGEINKTEFTIDQLTVPIESLARFYENFCWQPLGTDGGTVYGTVGAGAIFPDFVSDGTHIFNFTLDTSTNYFDIEFGDAGGEQLDNAEVVIFKYEEQNVGMVWDDALLFYRGENETLADRLALLEGQEVCGYNMVMPKTVVDYNYTVLGTETEAQITASRYVGKPTFFDKILSFWRK